MIYKSTYLTITILLSILPIFTQGQNSTLELSLEQSFLLLQSENKNLKIAQKETELAKNEHQKLNSFWYPNLSLSGAYVHMSNPIEVRQSLSQYTDPAKDFINSVLPNDQIIKSLLSEIGNYTLNIPLVSQNITSIDANIVWPIFTAGKRIFANRIGKTLVSIAEVNKEQTNATQKVLLIANYFGLRLNQRIIEVRKETCLSLSAHFEQALKLEEQGMINKAERLIAQVNMEEAKRELEQAHKDMIVAVQSLKSLINIKDSVEIQTITALFINENIPPVEYFKSMITPNNYIINQLKLQENITENELKIAKSAYFPNIELMGKQTIYNHGIDKYLLPRTMIGIGATWNIFDGLNREKNVRQAILNNQTLAIKKKQIVSDLEIAVDNFYVQMQNAIDNIKALNTTLAMSNELVRMRVKSFKEGMATSTDVIDAEVLLSKVKLAFLMAYYQYDIALANLLSICGIPEFFEQYRINGVAEIL